MNRVQFKEALRCGCERALLGLKTCNSREKYKDIISIQKRI